MSIELKGNNYYSRVFKRANYKLQNSMFWVVISEQDDSLQYINVRLDEKKNIRVEVWWSFLKGKKMHGYIIKIYANLWMKRIKNYVEQLDVWEVSNLKIITWINNSIDNLLDI